MPLVKKCCVPGCDSKNTHHVLHTFPHPFKEPERFNAWVAFIGGPILRIENNLRIHKYRAVCTAHFEEKFRCRSKRLTRNALPTLNLAGPSPDVSVISMSCQSKPRSLAPEFLQSILTVPGAHDIKHRSVPCKENVMGLQNRPQYKTYSRKILFKPIENIKAKVAHSPEDVIPMEIDTEKLMEIHTEKQSGSGDAPILNGSALICSSATPPRSSTTPTPPRPCTRRRLYPRTRTRAVCSPPTNTIRGGRMPETINKSNLKSNLEKTIYRTLQKTRAKLNRCKNKLQKQSASIKSANNILTNSKFLDALNKLPTSAKTLIEMQFRENIKKVKGRRFTENEKILALALFKKSPKAYRFLRKILILPAPHTVIKLINNANLQPGINENIFDQLKIQADKMTETEKLCVLLFDEMALKANLTYNERTDKVTGFVSNGSETTKTFADHAQVFMIRGLVKNCKQPIGYTFSAGATKGPELAKQIKQFVKKIHQAGFTVLATVCDQGSGNRSAIKWLIEESRAKWLKEGKEPKANVISIGEQEIVPLYDAPHLIKCIRNNLMVKDLEYLNKNNQKQTAKWSHVEALYKENPGYQGIRLIPKLSEKHVIPAKVGKMKVKYATQLFSQTVATNMGYLADKRVIPEECKATADIFLFFDQLFDSMNGSFYQKYKDAKPALGPATPSSVHHRIWREAKLFMNNMKFVNRISHKKETVPSLNNWVWTLNGLEILLKKLSVDYNVNSVWVRHLNQDPLENFFGSIRSHGCRNTNPTPERFQSAFASILINNLSGLHAPGANCEDDIASTLHALVVVDSKTKKTPAMDVNIENFESNILVDNEKINNPTVKASLEYCSGYFANLAKKKIFRNCHRCKLTFMAENESQYIRYREFSKKALALQSNLFLRKTYLGNAKHHIRHVKEKRRKKPA